MQIKTRRAGAVVVATTAATLLAASAQAALIISTDTTNNVTCSGGVCSATAADAVLNVTDLANLIAASPVTIQSGSEAQNIVFAASFSWTSVNSLKLETYRSIYVEEPIADLGPGALTLVTHEGDAKGKLSVQGKGSIHFLSTANQLTINGVAYSLVDSIVALAFGVAAAPDGAFALINDYDARPDGTYASTPIPTSLTGSVEGLGNTISNLSIASSNSSAGLFNNTAASAVISNLRLSQLVIENRVADSTVGGLIATNNGLLFNNIVKGAIAGSDTTTANSAKVGGLAGINYGTIERCQSGGKIDGAYFTAVGGLVAVNEGIIRYSYVQSHVSGGTYVGGLTAFNSSDGKHRGVISESYAAGRVIGKLHGGVAGDDNTFVGGLVGSNYGVVKRSHASADVVTVASSQGAAIAGGLIGYNVGAADAGFVRDSYATGAVVGKGEYVELGGLIGITFGETYGGHEYTGAVLNSYATGAVSGASENPNRVYVGGLVGYDKKDSGLLSTPITTSYSIGSVSSDSGGNVGGFIGGYGTEIDESYWDTVTSGKNKGTGDSGNVSGLTGLTTAQFQSGLPAGFDPVVWAQSPSVNNGYPYLIANPPAK